MSEAAPLFSKTFLWEVLKLQEAVMKITTDSNHTLADICFAPLANGGKAANTSQCLIQSIWGYYQNDATLLNTTDVEGYETYMDHYVKCTW